MLDDSLDEEHTEFQGVEHDDENTVFEANPFGARQRVALPRTFLAKVKTVVPQSAPRNRFLAKVKTMLPARPPKFLAKVKTMLPARPPKFLAKVKTMLPETFPMIGPALAPAGFTPVPAQPQLAASLLAIAFAPRAPRLYPPVPRLRRQRDRRAVIKRFAAPICGGLAVLLLLIAYISKPSSDDSRARRVVASLAPSPTPVAPIITPIEEPAAAPALEPTVPHVKAPRASKSSSKARTSSKRKAIRLSAKELSSPLGSLRPSRR